MTASRVCFYVMLGLVCLLFTACSDGSSTGPGNGTNRVPESYDESLPMLVAGFCEFAERCHDISGRVSNRLRANQDSCSQFSLPASLESIGDLNDRIEAGSILFDGTPLADCLQQVDNLSCDRDAAAFVRECRALTLQGTRLVGEACGRSEECAGESFCNKGGPILESCTGQCAPIVPAGEACTFADQCGPKAGCFGDRCRRRVVEEGGACLGTDEDACRLGLQCVGGDLDFSGVCRPWRRFLTRNVGETCDFMGFTGAFIESGDLCRSDLSCVFEDISSAPLSASGGTCVSPLAVGESCRPGFPDPCEPGLYCNANLNNTASPQGQCTALPKAGEPCVEKLLTSEDQDSGICAFDHYCDDTSVCRPYKATGEACDEGRECWTTACHPQSKRCVTQYAEVCDL